MSELAYALGWHPPDALGSIAFQSSLFGETESMAIRRPMLVSAVLVAALTSSSYAGPCSREIARIQASIDAKLDASAAKGASERESADALLHRQPTPRSIAAAEQRLGEASAKTTDVVAQAMTRARAADRAGDKSKCEQALTEVRRAIGQ